MQLELSASAHRDAAAAQEIVSLIARAHDIECRRWQHARVARTGLDCMRWPIGIDLFFASDGTPERIVISDYGAWYASEEARAISAELQDALSRRLPSLRVVVSARRRWLPLAP